MQRARFVDDGPAEAARAARLSVLPLGVADPLQHEVAVVERTHRLVQQRDPAVGHAADARDLRPGVVEGAIEIQLPAEHAPRLAQRRQVRVLSA